MIGYKVTLHEYSGKIRGDAVVWAHEGAARLRFDQLQAAEGEWEDTKFKQVEYEPLGDGECRVGRVIHQLRNDTRQEMVRAAALKKLNAEERAALQLDDK